MRKGDEMVEVTIKFKTSDENGKKIETFFKNDVMKDGPFGFLRASDSRYLDIPNTKDYKIKVSSPIKKKASRQKANVSIKDSKVSKEKPKPKKKK